MPKSNLTKTKKNKNSQAQGTKFEKIFCEFLKIFIKECFLLSTFILEPCIQQAGDQNGRDITAKWRHNGVLYDWWFECKSHELRGKYGKKIYKKELADKIIDMLVMGQTGPTCYCVVSKYKEQDKWLLDTIPKINNLGLGQSQILWWSPGSLSLKKCIALYPAIWEKMYSNEQMPNNLASKDDIINDLRREFIEVNSRRNYNGEDVGRIINDPSTNKLKKEHELLNQERINEAENIKEQFKYISKNDEKK
ncbi:MAG: hypothetical protein WC848_01385 [Parcubacteria group bacterium]|jgi:hypothetical protein